MDVKLSVSGISAMLKEKGIPDEFCEVFEGEFIAVCCSRLHVVWRATTFDFISELPFNLQKASLMEVLLSSYHKRTFANFCHQLGLQRSSL